MRGTMKKLFLIIFALLALTVNLYAEGIGFISSGSTPTEGTAVKSTGEAGGTKFLREDGDGTCSWQEAGGSTPPEGTAVLSTGEAGGTKFLREDGDGTSSWQEAGGNTEASTAAGQLLFGDGSGEWDHTETSELFWNDTNKRLGIGTASPIAPLHVAGNIYSTGYYQGSSAYLGNTIVSSYNLKTSAGDLNLVAGSDAGQTSNMTFQTNNAGTVTERMRITPTGNVAIGATTSTSSMLTLEGTMSLKEQAAADADTAAYGQIWVANSTPNELWFTDDAGTDTQLSSHPQDAPPELYINAPGQDFIGVKRHKLLGIIQWQTLDGVITEETFEAYNLRRKDVPGHTDLVKLDHAEWLERRKEAVKQEFIAENTVDVEAEKAEAFEMYDVEERAMVDVEVEEQEQYEEDVETIVDGEPVIEKVAKTRPVMRIKKQPKVIDEKISFKLEGEEVVEVREPVYEMKTVQVPKLKDGIRFDETDGKFYKKQAPSKEMIDNAVKDFEPELPDWMKARL